MALGVVTGAIDVRVDGTDPVSATLRMEIAPRPACTSDNDGAPCTDDNACTTNDACINARCLGDAVMCDDGAACTIDACDIVAGCTSTAVNALCDDSDPCTDDVCSTAGCAHPAKDEGALCGANGCVSISLCADGACVAFDVPNDSPCNDGDSCTANDVCRDNVCVSDNATGAEGLDDGVVVANIPTDTDTGDGRARILATDGNAFAWFYATPGAPGVDRSGHLMLTTPTSTVELRIDLVLDGLRAAAFDDAGRLWFVVVSTELSLWRADEGTPRVSLLRPEGLIEVALDAETNGVVVVATSSDGSIESDVVFNAIRIDNDVVTTWSAWVPRVSPVGTISAAVIVPDATPPRALLADTGNGDIIEATLGDTATFSRVGAVDAIGSLAFSRMHDRTVVATASGGNVAYTTQLWLLRETASGWSSSLLDVSHRAMPVTAVDLRMLDNGQPLIAVSSFGRTSLLRVAADDTATLVEEVEGTALTFSESGAFVVQTSIDGVRPIRSRNNVCEAPYQRPSSCNVVTACAIDEVCVRNCLTTGVCVPAPECEGRLSPHIIVVDGCYDVSCATNLCTHLDDSCG
jgi:hypothetical protein